MKYYLISTTLLIVLVASSVLAHTGATGIVKERMEAMSDMGDKAKIVSDMFKGKTNFKIASVVEAADAFVVHGSSMKDLFPDTKPSRTGKTTRALSAIWEDWNGFTSQVVEFESNSEKLLKLSQDTTDVDVLKKAFTTAAKNCSGCHKQFREPKK